MIIILNKEIKEPFEDRIFEDKVHFVYQKEIKSDDSSTLKFIRCQFLKGISFDSVDVSKSKIREITIQFNDCLITNSLYINCFEKEDNQLLSFQISNSLVHYFEIKESKVSAVELNRTILSHLFSLKSSKLGALSMSNCLGNFSLNDEGYCKFYMHFSDYNLLVERSPILRFWKNLKELRKLESILYIPTICKLNNLKSIQITFNEKSNLEGYHLISGHNSYGEKIKLKKYFLTAEDLSKMKIFIDIDNKKSVTESILINSAILERLYIKGESESTVKLEHLQVDNIYFEEFSSKNLQMYDIEPRNNSETRFQVVNSNFTDANFVKVYFNLFKQVNFYRSYFEQSKFSASSFPNEILSVKNVHYFDKKEEDYQWIQYELFRQLKTSLLSNNNQLQALEMHSRMYNALRSANRLKWQDKFILFLNRISNNHATSIWRPFILSVALLVILWIWYCACLPNVPFKLGWYGLEEFKKGIASFSVFIENNLKSLVVLANPVHSTNNLEDLLGEKMKLTTMNYFISFLSRILMAWLFYQFISAFRKFGKTM
jgi:hypothetical protein